MTSRVLLEELRRSLDGYPARLLEAGDQEAAPRRFASCRVAARVRTLPHGTDGSLLDDEEGWRLGLDDEMDAVEMSVEIRGEIIPRTIPAPVRPGSRRGGNR